MAPAPDAAGPLSRQVLSYLYAHPGAATSTGGRRFYSDAFRHFVLELFATSNADLETFAKAIDVPAGTLDGWLRLDRCREDDEASSTSAPEADAPLPEDASLHIQSTIAAWRGWSGTFEDFVGHVQRHLRILFGRSFIARVLFTYNERIPRRRAGRSPDEEATRGSFEVFFPDAQWIGDGMQVCVVINGERFDFNLELDIDAHSGAFVGASIRDEEDSRAVIEAFEDAALTTDKRPLALDRMRKFLDDAGYLDTKSEHVPSALERWYLRSLDEPSGLTPTRGVTAPDVAQAGGFTVHASVTVARGDARGREQLCRYITRPPFSERQLARTSDGRVELQISEVRTP